MKRIKFKKVSAIITMLIILSLFVTGCNKEGNQAGTENENKQSSTNTDSKDDKIEFEDDSYIVDLNWLKENMENEDVLILDARGEEAYNKGHIPGSIAVTWQQFSVMQGQPGDENWGTVLEGKELSEKLSEVGITKDKKIVVYADTQKGWGDEGRIVWMLRGVGLENAVMLDGGFNYWKSEKNEVSKETKKPTPSTIEVSSIDTGVDIKTDELIEKLDKVKIIDVRSSKEYSGAIDYGESRGGHIPGSININFMEFLDKDGTLKEASEIKSILDKNGIKKGDEIVTYCTAGIRSAHMQIVLDMLGYKDAKNYDQSFYAWAGNKDLEVIK